MRASMGLFGHLSKFVSKKSSLFGAEVEKSMETLLIHLQDEDPLVAQVSTAEDSWVTTCKGGANSPPPPIPRSPSQCRPVTSRTGTPH
ncbi:maestro heat-like repeat-containing protein family member 1 [Chelydra serpentina]|uniref:Maestro heat-like repeat-containing protein family member 1 n=1 Tax=Chelydra serpentina TaxID=8475 RepID=A0A8T1S2Q2_CHESE|nr:maestro heat-like repeat-containing protein family member 1 [Chelydra serpentina]